MIALGLLAGTGCAVFRTRPTQEMSDTQAAMRAAKDVQADTLAPEIYREAADWWQRAKREYKLKNFALASEFAEKARVLAEQSEFEAVRGGGVREEPPDPLADRPPSRYQPYPYPTPTGTPAEVYEQRRQDESRGSGGGITPAPAQSGLAPVR